MIIVKLIKILPFITAKVNIYFKCRVISSLFFAEYFVFLAQFAKISLYSFLIVFVKLFPELFYLASVRLTEAHVSFVNITSHHCCLRFTYFICLGGCKVKQK